jgi:DNA-binding MarR family transcriptional regulator
LNEPQAVSSKCNQPTTSLRRIWREQDIQLYAESIVRNVNAVNHHPTRPDTKMSDELILEEFLPYRLSVLSHTVSTTIAGVYEKRFGVSIPEWRVIAILGRFPGLSAVDVAERTLMDKVAVSRAVTKLVKNGRIDRQFADADRRRSILNLSEEGRKVHDEIAPLALQFERELLDGIDDDDVRTLDTLIDGLMAKARLLGK